MVSSDIRTCELPFLTRVVRGVGNSCLMRFIGLLDWGWEAGMKGTRLMENGSCGGGCKKVLGIWFPWRFVGKWGPKETWKGEGLDVSCAANTAGVDCVSRSSGFATRCGSGLTTEGLPVSILRVLL